MNEIGKLIKIGQFCPKFLQQWYGDETGRHGSGNNGQHGRMGLFVNNLICQLIKRL